MHISNFIETNLNPTGKKRGDCVIRAIMKALKRSWKDVYTDLCEMGKEMFAMPNDPVIWHKYLEQNGWKKQPMPRFPDNTRYMVKEFQEANSKGTFIVSVANHLTVIEDGKLYDMWDCGNKSVGNYWKP
jgi:hypothetical protein